MTTSNSPEPVRTDPGSDPPVLRSCELLAGAHEVLIEHGDEVYRLKLTGRGKLTSCGVIAAGAFHLLQRRFVKVNRSS